MPMHVMTDGDSMSYNGNYGNSGSRFEQRDQQQQPQQPGTQQNRQQPQDPPLTTSPNFDILDWHPAYESCQRYFLDHAQHEAGTQALCALINIRLPFQWLQNPVTSSNSSQMPGASPGAGGPSFNFNQWSRPNSSATGRSSQPTSAFVSLVPYIRRLVITGFDKPGILHGFFGDAYQAGITPMQDCERRNYLFAAKHGGWRTCKKQYDMNAEETVPFLKPLQSIRDEELDAAEKSWSSWLAMEDWMIGPRAPHEDSSQDQSSQRSRPWERAGAMSGYDAGLPDGI
ncbi:hypothetical protein D6D17_05961 [Aureobasidium pullulans]|nr:hypothetical protein D6D17_05961 [Aureobasidium pullulans]